MPDTSSSMRLLFDYQLREWVKFWVDHWVPMKGYFSRVSVFQKCKMKTTWLWERNHDSEAIFDSENEFLEEYNIRFYSSKRLASLYLSTLNLGISPVTKFCQIEIQALCAGYTVYGILISTTSIAKKNAWAEETCDPAPSVCFAISIFQTSW